MKITVCVVILVFSALVESQNRFDRKKELTLERLNNGGYELSESNHQGSLISLNTASSNSNQANIYGTTTSYTIDHGNIQEITITRKIPVAVPADEEYSRNPVHYGNDIIPLKNNKLNTAISQKTTVSKPITISVSHPIVVEKSVSSPYQSYSSNSNDCNGGTCSEWIAIRSNNKNIAKSHFANVPNADLQLVSHVSNNVGYNELPVRGGPNIALHSAAVTPTSNGVESHILNNNLIIHSAPTKHGEKNRAGVSFYNVYKNKPVRPINSNNQLISNNIYSTSHNNKGEQLINNVVNGAVNDIHGTGMGPAFVNNIGTHVPIIIDNYNVPIPNNAFHIQGKLNGGHIINNNFRESGLDSLPHSHNVRGFGVSNGHSGNVRGHVPILIDENNLVYKNLAFHNGNLNDSLGNAYKSNIAIQNGHHNSGLPNNAIYNLVSTFSDGAYIGGHINQLPVHNVNHNSIPVPNILNNGGIGLSNTGISGDYLNNIGNLRSNHGPIANFITNRENRYANIGLTRNHGNYVDIPVLNNIIPQPFTVNGNTLNKNQGSSHGINVGDLGKNIRNHVNIPALNQFGPQPFHSNGYTPNEIQSNYHSGNTGSHGNTISNYFGVPIQNKFEPQLTGAKGNTPNKSQINSDSGNAGNHRNVGNHINIPILNQLLPQPFSSNGNTHNKPQVSSGNHGNIIENYDHVPILNKFGSHRFNTNGNVYKSLQGNLQDNNNVKNIRNNINSFGISNIMPNNIHHSISNGLNIKTHGNGIGISFVNQNPGHTGHGNVKNILHSINGVENTGNNILSGNIISDSHGVSPNYGEISDIPIFSNIGNNNGQLEELLKNLILHVTSKGNNIGKIPHLPSVYDTQNPELVSNYKNGFNSNGGVNSGSLIGGHIKNIAWPLKNFESSVTPNFGNINIGHAQNTFGKIPADHAKSTVTFLNIGSAGKINSESLTNDEKNAIAVLIKNGGNFDTSSSNSGTHSAHLNENHDNGPISLDFGEIVYGKKKQNVEIISKNKGQNGHLNDDFDNSGLGILENIVIATAGKTGDHNSISHSSDNRKKQNSDSFGKYNNNESQTKNLAISGVELIGNGDNNVVSSTETILVTSEKIEVTDTKSDEKTDYGNKLQEDYGNKLKLSSKTVSKETSKKSDKKSR